MPHPPIPRWIHTATTVLTLLLAGSAQATVQSAVHIESRVTVRNDPAIVKTDPSDRPLRIVDGFTVGSSIENFASFTDPWSGQLLGATARGRSGLEAGLPRLELLTARDTGGGFYRDPSAYIEGGSLLTITGHFTGVAGSRALVSLDGLFAAAVAPAATPPGGGSGAMVDFSASLVLTGPGQAACPAQRCLDSARLLERFDNGSLPAGGLAQAFTLSLEATVGDSFELSFSVAATASNGYSVLIGPPAGVPLARGASAMAAAGSFAGISGVRLGNGLGLSADSGLTRQADGRWTLPSAPVPEPGMAWLWAAGLAGLWCRRGRR